MLALRSRYSLQGPQHRALQPVERPHDLDLEAATVGFGWSRMPGPSRRSPSPPLQGEPTGATGPASLRGVIAPGWSRCPHRLPRLRPTRLPWPNRASPWRPCSAPWWASARPTRWPGIHRRPRTPSCSKSSRASGASVVPHRCRRPRCCPTRSDRCSLSCPTPCWPSGIARSCCSASQAASVGPSLSASMSRTPTSRRMGWWRPCASPRPTRKDRVVAWVSRSARRRWPVRCGQRGPGSMRHRSRKALSFVPSDAGVTSRLPS